MLAVDYLTSNNVVNIFRKDLEKKFSLLHLKLTFILMKIFMNQLTVAMGSPLVPVLANS